MRRIKAFAERIGEVIPVEQLSLRLRDQKNHPLNLLSSPLTLTLSAQHTNSAFTPVTMSIIDFGGVIPDEFLRQPITTRNIQHIQHICDTVTRGQSTASRIICDRDLLQRAFSASICDDDSLVFFTLFTLEALLDTTHGVVVDYRHLEWAVRKGRTRFLIAIIKKLWSYPRRFRPSDADLVDLINEAKACNHTDWPKTTRILAMEVASMWKAAEVEDAGGLEPPPGHEVGRHLADHEQRHHDGEHHPGGRGADVQRPDQHRTAHQQGAGQERHHDAEQADQDRQGHEGLHDRQGAHGRTISRLRTRRDPGR